MPTFEYACGKCSHRFEVLVRAGQRKKPACAKCGSKNVSKKFSVFLMNFGAQAGPSTGGKLCGCGQDGCAPCSAGL